MPEIDKVADYIVASLHEAGDEISNLKLQKLLYFAQGLCLANCGKPLFDESLIAWKLGPVSMSTFKRFEHFKQHDIDDPNIRKPDDLPDETVTHLDMVIEALGGLPAIELMKMAHKTTPWLEVWERSKIDIYPGDEISQDSMRAFFSQLEDEIMTMICRRIENEDSEESQKDDLTLDQVRRLRESA